MITTTKQEYSSLIAYRTTLPWLIGITTQIKPAGLYRDWVWSPDPAACLRVRLVTAVRDSSRKMALYSPPLPATSRLMQSGVLVVVLVLRAEQLTASLLELPVYATTGNPTLSAFFLENYFDAITFVYYCMIISENGLFWTYFGDKTFRGGPCNISAESLVRTTLSRCSVHANNN